VKTFGTKRTYKKIGSQKCIKEECLEIAKSEKSEEKYHTFFNHEEISTEIKE
jgi:hypothetical protein